MPRRPGGEESEDENEFVQQRLELASASTAKDVLQALADLGVLPLTAEGLVDSGCVPPQYPADPYV
jgi:hypothetical protein